MVVGALKSVVAFLRSVHFINLVKTISIGFLGILKPAGIGATLSSNINAMPDDQADLRTDSANQYFDGIFRKQVVCDGQAMNYGDYQQLFGETIKCVKRYACSLTGWFPSGVLTPVTLLISGKATRHEFTIVHTFRHVLKLQITKKSNNPTEPITDIQILSAGNTSKSRDAAESKLLKEHWYSRVMKQVDGSDLLADMSFGQLDAYCSYLIAIMRYCGAKKYHLLTSNCKSLDRSYTSARKTQT